MPTYAKLSVPWDNYLNKLVGMISMYFFLIIYFGIPYSYFITGWFSNMSFHVSFMTNIVKLMIYNVLNDIGSHGWIAQDGTYEYISNMYIIWLMHPVMRYYLWSYRMSKMEINQMLLSHELQGDSQCICKIMS